LAIPLSSVGDGEHRTLARPFLKETIESQIKFAVPKCGSFRNGKVISANDIEVVDDALSVDFRVEDDDPHACLQPVEVEILGRLVSLAVI